MCGAGISSWSYLGASETIGNEWAPDTPTDVIAWMGQANYWEQELMPIQLTQPAPSTRQTSTIIVFLNTAWSDLLICDRKFAIANFEADCYYAWIYHSFWRSRKKAERQMQRKNKLHSRWLLKQPRTFCFFLSLIFFWKEWFFRVLIFTEKVIKSGEFDPQKT